MHFDVNKEPLSTSTWPMQAAQDSYGAVFRQLVRLKRAEHGLRDLWLALQRASSARGISPSGC
jgi:hypothetical protein